MNHTEGRYFPFFDVLGIVEGNSELEIKVTFSPMDFSTAHMKLQVILAVTFIVINSSTKIWNEMS